MTADASPFGATIPELGRRVIDTVGIPKDRWEIAAQLEVLGLRDADARSAYGLRDLFDLAGAIDARFRAGEFAVDIEPPVDEEHVSEVLRFVRQYLRGITFAVPMALQAAAMLLWGYGIWGGIDLALWEGSAIALGFIASYIVAGAFAQAIVRRGLFYIYQAEEGLARWTALRGFAIAARSMLVLLVPAALLNVVFHILPWPMVFIAAAYYVGLGVLWLSWALLYLVRKTHYLIAITIVALTCVALAARVGHLQPLMVNAIGVVTADALSLGAAILTLNRMVRKRGNQEPVNPPRLAVLVFSTSRYFVYGLLFSAFLFADRVVAWTTSVGRDDFPPYCFWLNVRYELALDLALIVAIIMSGVVEHAVERFSETLIPLEKWTGSADREPFLREQLRIYRRRTMQLLLAAVIAVPAAILVLRALQQVPNPRLHETLTHAVTTRVFFAAAAGFAFLTFAVRDLLLLLTLSRVDAAVRAVAIALAADIAVGYVLSRSMGYGWAVGGFVCGAIVMWIAAGRSIRQTFARLDYYYYSAY